MSGMSTSESLLGSQSAGVRPATAARRAVAQALVLVVAAIAVTAVNLVVFGLARADDVSMIVRAEGSAPHQVHAADVVGASTVPLLAGTLLAVALSLAWSPVLRIAQVVGGGLAVVSAFGPLLSQSDGGTKATLATMHLLVGVALVAGLDVARRRTQQT
jgi:hypothetical protein